MRGRCDRPALLENHSFLLTPGVRTGHPFRTDGWCMRHHTSTNPNGSDHKKMSDDELLRLLVSGDRHAGGELYFRHLGSIRRVCRSVVRDPELADDVAQDTFLEFLGQAHAVDVDRGSVATFLHLVARRRAIDAVRRTERTRARDHDSWDRQKQSEATAEAEVVAASIRGVVRGAVARLPEPQRQIVDLTYFGHQSTQQAATILGIPAGTAKSRRRLALARLARDHRICSTFN